MDILITTITGSQDILAKEIESFGYKVKKIQRGGVWISGGLKELYFLNYNLRTASKVLLKVYSSNIKEVNDISKKAFNVNWDDYFSAQSKIMVESTVIENTSIKNTMYVNQLVKDGIVDKFRKLYDKRPSVSKDHFEIKISAFIKKNKLTLYLDSSGFPLYRRNYKDGYSFIAPIKEHLASIILYHMKFDENTILFDPMCGSGTILTEASLMATKTPPGTLREFYCFKFWKNFDKNLFSKVKKSSEKSIKKNPIANQFYGADINKKAVKLLKETVKNPVFQNSISIKSQDFTKIKDKFKSGNKNSIIFMNPPYGKRLDEEKDLENLYKNIGEVLKHNFSGFTAYILTGNLKMIKKIQLRPSAKTTLYNGPIECRLVKYDLY